ncbi:hypothetical protein J4219_07520 [Candidatus Woesearchaeota archaeon]|nr:hypothetical protein [Candidatus Woesearchaeota archaeon]
MEENHAIIGVLLISAISISMFFVMNDGSSGAVTQPYLSCCCNILADNDNGEQALFRSQIQTFEQNCSVACQRYSKEGKVFPQEGLCVNNP